MRRQERLVGMLAVFLLGAGGLWGADGAGGVWKSNFADAQAEAKRQDRPIVLHFYGTWCPPCKRMDREVLYTEEVLGALKKGFVAVKLNIEAHPDLQKRYGVEAVPTDVIISPDGKLLAQAQGFQDRAKYLAFADGVSRKYIAARPKPQPPVAVATTAPKPGPATTPAPAIAKVPTQTASIAQADKLVPDPIDIPGTAAPLAAQQKPDIRPAASSTELAPPTAEQLALDGFCPVTLWTTRTWIPGQEKFSFTYENLTYQFASQKELDEFKADPHRFAPRLLGCDPVILTETEIAVPGTTRYGAYYEGELYLFETADSRSKFRGDPLRYTKTKHVLKPDDIKRRRA